MKKYLLLIIFISLASSAACQKQDTLFSNYLNKFVECSLPMDIDSISSKLNIHANDKCNITEKEFIHFVKNDTVSFWKYLMYNEKKQINDFFNYVTLCKFSIGESFIAILHFQSYFDKDVTKEQYETILSIFDISGKVIDRIVLSASYDDNFASDIDFDEVNYSAVISENYDIEITYNVYTWKDNRENMSKEYYEINNSGKIIKK